MRILKRLFARSTDASSKADTGVDTRRTDRQRRGAEGERLARAHLEAAGLVFVAANVRYRDGEIDLVMRDHGQNARALVFVEVRSRKSGAYGGAAASVTAAKQRRLIAAAEHYFAAHHARAAPACRFDVVSIEGDDVATHRIVWLRDAFAVE